MSKFSVCVLTYGDYPGLARRCLGSIIESSPWRYVADLRIGANNISDSTSAVLVKMLDSLAGRVSIPVYSYAAGLGGERVGKYPLMRRMLYDAGLPLSDYVVWFDDDSFIDPSLGEAWWRDLASFVDANDADMVGSLYRLTGGYRPSQADGIRNSRWYAGKEIGNPLFATGGWWAARSSVLAAWDYPFPEIDHNGGDSILGQLIHQRGYKLCAYKRGVYINWDGSRGGESRARRRGFTTSWPYEAGHVPPSHDFPCLVTCHTHLPATPAKTEVDVGP